MAEACGLVSQGDCAVAGGGVLLTCGDIPAWAAMQGQKLEPVLMHVDTASHVTLCPYYANKRQTLA